jgi:transposase
MDPPDRALVLCVDDNRRSRALDRTKPLLPMRPGQVERRTHDYVRHGTTSLFAALNVKTGEIIGQCHPRHRAIEFRKFLDNTVEAAVPEDLTIHLLLDNYATHKTPLIRLWLAKRPRVHLHFTPVGASWVNLVERWFVVLTEKQLRRGAHRSTRALEAAIAEYISVSNERPKPFVWTKTADEILASVERFCRRISDSRDWERVGRSRLKAATRSPRRRRCGTSRSGSRGSWAAAPAALRRYRRRSAGPCRR